MSESNPVFEFQNVRYKEIFRSAQLRIPDQTVTCVYGESGAGKTTLLRLLNHLISPTSGTLKYRGSDITQLEPVHLRREVVMLSQTPVIYDGTIRDNLAAGLRFSERTIPDDARLQRALKGVQLDKSLGMDASKLSGGEKQRIALARVMLMDPRVLLLDEPSAALDEDTETLVIEHVVRYAKDQERPVIMITHARRIVEAYAEFLVEMEHGDVHRAEEVTPAWQTEES